MSTLAKRLKAARLKRGISQEQLGIEAGIDPASASARMNRYELGKRVPAPALVERIADVLGLPVAYFYASTDEEAALLQGFHQLPTTKKHILLEQLNALRTTPAGGHN